MSEVIKLEHGGGGRLMRKLLEEVIISAYGHNRVGGGVGLPEMDDGATIPIDGRHIVFTTDTYTVKPLFFPGGDMGRLAACGTVNDIAVMGATPLALSSALTVEEGLPIEVLKRIVGSMSGTLEEIGVPLIAGDTKVVERGGLDEILVSTSGIGVTETVVTDAGLKPGDRIILSGTIGNHELALLASREGLSLDAPLESDVAPLWGMISGGLKVGGITAMKDPTRGGVSGALNDVARKSGVDILMREEEIPVKGMVRSASELLGLDPLELANEGVAVIGVEEARAEAVLEALKRDKYGRDAAIAGEVLEGEGRVILETFVGGRRVVREPVGSPTPRIC
ncbi:MAG: hydrogenase expression/formation protein HypE [Candidatus Bathyarchaeota archaeon]|nr:hydrogenase expression/formation protein HypE [Candidatus Bathyarchaeota archaeon]